MKKLFFSLALSLIVLSVNISAQVLDKDTEAATKKLFHPDLIGVELKLQGEYFGKDGEKQVGVQVVARGGKSFHALVLDGGLPGAGWDGGKYSLLESGPLADGRVEFRSPNDEGTSAGLDDKRVFPAD